MPSTPGGRSRHPPALKPRRSGGSWPPRERVGRERLQRRAPRRDSRSGSPSLPPGIVRRHPTLCVVFPFPDRPLQRRPPITIGLFEEVAVRFPNGSRAPLACLLAGLFACAAVPQTARAETSVGVHIGPSGFEFGF